MASKFDTYATTTYFVRLAQDAKVFTRKDGGDDVVLTFVDDSRVEKTEQLWVDARVAKFQAERAKMHRKGDLVQVSGKLRFKLQDDGKYRGKIYDATVFSMEKLKDRENALVGIAEPTPTPTPETSAPVFE